MSVTKRISTGDYNLTTVAAGANTIITTDTVKIYGNLFVQGNSSFINVANVSTADPTIQFNSNAGAIFNGNSGLEVNRPGSYTPGLYWNETVKAWQIVSNIADPGTYVNIATVTAGTGTVSSGTATHIPYYATSGDTVSDGGANLTWNGANLLVIGGNVQTNGLRLTNVALAPSALTGNITFSGNTSGNSVGGTGVYFNNNVESGELISKQRALAFSIIFG